MEAENEIVIDNLLEKCKLLQDKYDLQVQINSDLLERSVAKDKMIHDQYSQFIDAIDTQIKYRRNWIKEDRWFLYSFMAAIIFNLICAAIFLNHSSKIKTEQTIQIPSTSQNK